MDSYPLLVEAAVFIVIDRSNVKMFDVLYGAGVVHDLRPLVVSEIKSAHVMREDRLLSAAQ